jgi:N-formylglutamate amidohydrolase
MTAGDFADIPAFHVVDVPAQHVPFVFNSPHSGRHYPPRFLAMSRLDAATIRRSEDCFVDELFASATSVGAPMLAANFPRAYLDVNREPWELDPRMFIETLPAFANIRSPRVAGGLGTVPRLVGEGLDIYGARLPLAEAVGRVEHVYKPYHDRLRLLLSRTAARFGRAVLVDCHSMPASIRVGENGARPDFIVGDRFGASCSAALTERAISLLVAMGYTVAHNKPYAGGFITEHYGRPARGLHALQIEVNRGLYMNERSYEKTAGFAALANDLKAFLAALTEAEAEFYSPPALAAE